MAAEILPGKTTAELYMAIGCQKHAKTESYREYLRYVTTADEQFIEAPGIRGMVMLVFTLPGFDRVFKVIKDRFAPQKEMTAAHVRACYQLVKEHDRVGRMADTQEFENFVLDKQQIDPALMALLLKEASGNITDLGDKIVISHLYIERRMVPLNLWLEQSEGQVLRDAIEEYGNAIRQLAAANIFPGDMLFKNFGVTRHGRVVFYDYDEICYMTEVNFRDIPPPRYPEDELVSEPWYSVSPGDVFPEEFRHWLCADPRIGPLFEEMHADLFRASYWRGLQTRIKNGHVEDVYAYRRKQRFSVRYGADSSGFTPPSGKVNANQAYLKCHTPYASVTSFAALITSAPNSVTRSSVIREMGPGDGDCRERFAMFIVNAGGDAAQAERVLLIIERVATLAG